MEQQLKEAEKIDSPTGNEAVLFKQFQQFSLVKIKKQLNLLFEFFRMAHKMVPKQRLFNQLLIHLAQNLQFMTLLQWILSKVCFNIMIKVFKSIISKIIMILKLKK